MLCEVSIEDVFAAHAVAMQMDPSSDPTVPAHALARVDASLGAARLAAFYVGDDDPALIYAAAILRSVMQNHPFVDGNKKTAWICCTLSLARAGYGLNVADFEVVDLCVRTLVDHLGLDEIAEHLGAWVVVA